MNLKKTVIRNKISLTKTYATIPELFHQMQEASRSRRSRRGTTLAGVEAPHLQLPTQDQGKSSETPRERGTSSHGADAGASQKEDPQGWEHP